MGVELPGGAVVGKDPIIGGGECPSRVRAMHPVYSSPFGLY